MNFLLSFCSSPCLVLSLFLTKQNIPQTLFTRVVLESFRFEDENEDEDEDEAPGFRYKEIFKFFRLQIGRDNVVAINFVVPAKLKTKKFEDFVVVKTESFVLVLDFVLVLESKALYYMVVYFYRLLGLQLEILKREGYQRSMHKRLD